MASGAAEIDFGGETLDMPNYGENAWPQMGSGDWAKYGFKEAAYQRNISMSTH